MDNDVSVEQKGREAGGRKKMENISIEKLAEIKNVPADLFAGLKVFCSWGTGKMVCEKEFDGALKRFLNAPADGRGKKEESNG